MVSFDDDVLSWKEAAEWEREDTHPPMLCAAYSSGSHSRGEPLELVSTSLT